MIVSQFLGSPYLNKKLGNQLFELASLIGLAKRYDTSLVVTNEWQYRSYFRLESFVEFRNIESYIVIREPGFHCCLDFFDKLEFLIKEEKVSIEGFLQSEQYWKPFEVSVRELFSFTESVRESANHFLKDNFINVDEFVAISVRRGDFLTDPGHYLLPIEYYAGAIAEFFPDKGIMIFSDDIPWCKENFKIFNKKSLLQKIKMQLNN